MFDACESACAHCDQESNRLKAYIVDFYFIRRFGIHSQLFAVKHGDTTQLVQLITTHLYVWPP